MSEKKTMATNIICKIDLSRRRDGVVFYGTFVS